MDYWISPNNWQTVHPIPRSVVQSARAARRAADGRDKEAWARVVCGCAGRLGTDSLPDRMTREPGRGWRKMGGAFVERVYGALHTRKTDIDMPL